MGRLLDLPGGCRWGLIFTAGAILGIYVACNTASTPQRVDGPMVSGNRSPLLTITEPTANLTLGQGVIFSISWTDQDRDSAALVSFALVHTNPSASPATIPLVEGIPENDSAAPDTITVSTAFVPRGSYYLQGTIADGVNTPVSVFATTAEPAETRIVITVGEEGTTPSNLPPTVYVAEPLFNLSVTLDDTIVIQVRPTEDPTDTGTPYDADDDTLLYISLDLDPDPDTGDPMNPDPDEIILLLDAPITIPQGAAEPLAPIPISVDLDRFPAREDGKPYYIRATITDEINEPRDAYATGTINVTRSATGRVDLGKVGGTLTGVRWLGLNPGARLGTAMTGVTNFDRRPATEDDEGDDVDDCVLVAQFGVPTGLTGVGEAYLIYGQDNLRFGGRIIVNTVGTNVAGATLLGPSPGGQGSGETNGITSVGYVPDLSGDGRPELLVGCSYVDGVRQWRDDDPSDTGPEARDTFEVEIQQGRLQITDTRTGEVVVGPLFTYDGAIDTYLDVDNPATNFGTDEVLIVNSSEVEEEVTPRQWVLIKFDGLRSFVPDFSVGRWDDDDVQGEITEAVLEFEAVDRGAAPTLFPLRRNFNETSTYAAWPQNGGDPEEDVDYDSDSLNFENDFIVTGTNTAIVTDTIEELFDGARDIIGWIMVPATEGVDDGVTFMSGDDMVTEERPLLRITYTILKPEGANNDGCYPDNMPNNTSNNPEIQGSVDDIIAERRDTERLGMVALIYSENRDSEGVIDPDRLTRAKVRIDHAGQRPQDERGINARPFAALPGTTRLAGSRFQVAMYDVIDYQNLGPPAIRAEFGARVASIPDINNNQVPELIMSAPKNELDIEELRARYPDLTDEEIPHLLSRPLRGNILLFHGRDFDAIREDSGSATFPHFDTTFRGSCTPPTRGRGLNLRPYDWIVIFGEHPEDELGDGSSAGDFNLDGSPDVLCGAWLADGPTRTNVGATYVVYGRQFNENQEIELADANDPSIRPPMLRIRGDKPEDRIGWAQESVLDINGNRIDDIVLASPFADASGVSAGDCSRDFNGSGSLDSEDQAAFSSCRAQFGNADLSSDHECAFFDYNNDRQVDELDAAVFAGAECPADNGVIAVVFGGISLDGDRRVAQIATSDLPGLVLYGAKAGDRAGHDVASAGDFNRDGFGDLLITAPGATAQDNDGRTRVGVVYLIFGGPHLNNRRFSLADVGSGNLPGLVFLSPYEDGAPDEAPPQYVAGLGDLNNDGFADIGIGNPLADFVDELLPQTPGSPGSDLTTGRRRDAGEIYMIYGHNITESNP